MVASLPSDILGKIVDQTREAAVKHEFQFQSDAVLVCPMTQRLFDLGCLQSSHILHERIAVGDNVLRVYVSGNNRETKLSIYRFNKVCCGYMPCNFGNFPNFSFEGFNNNKMGVFVCSSRAHKSSIVVLDPGLMLTPNGVTNYSLWGIEIGSDFHKSYGYGSFIDGSITALALHTDDNIIAFSVYNPRTKNSCIRIASIDFERRQAGRAPRSVVSDHASCVQSYACQKIVHFGQQYYGLVTCDGFFKFFERRRKSIIIHDQKHGTLRFKDLAINREHTDIRSRKFRCALLSDKGDLYSADLWSLKKPTLLYVDTIPDVNLVQNIYYEGDELKVVYHVPGDPQIIAKIDKYKDNFIMLWLKACIHQYELKR
jgi:hypothetical protein